MSKPFVISIPKINPAIKIAISIPVILTEGEALDDNKKVIVYVGGNIAKRKKEAFEMMDAMYVKIETFIASLGPSDKRDVLDDMEQSVSGFGYQSEHNLVLDWYLKERQKAMPSLAPTLTNMINEIKANR